MNGYLYETHLHTSEASACGRTSGSDYIDFMISRGYHGMIVTDHFFTGNSAIDEELPWEEKVDLYMQGYEKALEAARGKDFDVLFGIEFNFERDEYLIYGPAREWLLASEAIMTMTRREVYECVHSAGGILVHAHPYRERHYVTNIKLMPEICDAIEVYNAGNTDNQNALGYEYATSLGLPMTAGSDIHKCHDNAMGGMLLPRRARTPYEYAAMVTAGEGTPVRVMDGRIDAVADIPDLTVPVSGPTLPVVKM